MVRTSRRMRKMKQSRKRNPKANATMANIVARTKSTNKSIAAAIGGRRTRRRLGKKGIPKSIAMRAIKANRRVASAASAAIIG
jgi:transposase